MPSIVLDPVLSRNLRILLSKGVLSASSLAQQPAFDKSRGQRISREKNPAVPFKSDVLI